MKGNLSISKNEKLPRFFLNNPENINTLQTFLANPFYFGISPKMREICKEMTFEYLPDPVDQFRDKSGLKKVDSLCMMDE